MNDSIAELQLKGVAKAQGEVVLNATPDTALHHHVSSSVVRAFLALEIFQPNHCNGNH